MEPILDLIRLAFLDTVDGIVDKGASQQHYVIRTSRFTLLFELSTCLDSVNLALIGLIRQALWQWIGKASRQLRKFAHSLDPTFALPTVYKADIPLSPYGGPPFIVVYKSETDLGNTGSISNGTGTKHRVRAREVERVEQVDAIEFQIES